jgi:PAS domain S-box-containing protein
MDTFPPAVYEDLLGHAADVITVVDRSGTVRYESPSLERMFGYEPAELVGDSVFQYVHPDDREDALSAFRRLRESETGDAVEAIELRFRHSDGSWVWVESRATNRTASEIDGYVITSRDISARKEREREIERMHDLLEHTERIADVGGWEIDTESREVFWTDHLFELLGVDYRAEPPLEEALDVYHEDDRPRVERAVDDALATGEPFDVEARYRRPNEEVRCFRIQGVPSVESGDVVTLRGAVQDVTDQRERERQLTQQNHRLEEFASVVSHDLRNPLTLAKGRLELAAAECDSDHLEAIDTALDRMDRLIEDLLWLVREGRDIGHPRPVSLHERIESAWTIAAGGRSGADLTVVDADRLGTVEVDPNRLQQLLENLFRNALDHGGSGVAVTVGALEGGDGFYVADDGPGIPGHLRERVFEPGFSTSTDGTGFGLDIVERIADAHGWDLDVIESDGRGARFEISGVDAASG